jgi:hypothetical protein
MSVLNIIHLESYHHEYTFPSNAVPYEDQSGVNATRVRLFPSSLPDIVVYGSSHSANSIAAYIVGTVDHLRHLRIFCALVCSRRITQIY